jgi:hypothetical protein
MLAGILLAAAASTAAVSVPTARPFPQVLPVAVPGLRCPDGGRAIGDRVGKSYILQILEIVTFEKDPKVVGFVYSDAGGNDYVDLSPSDPGAKVHLLQDGEIARASAMMRYCFSAPWDGKRNSSP